MGERWHGLRFPFKKTPQGLFQDAEDDEIIESSIKFILSTGLGEYICLPEFGCLLQEDLFEQNDDVLKSLARRHVRDALSRWEPRITVLEVSAEADEHELTILIQYLRRDFPERLRYFSETFERQPA